MIHFKPYEYPDYEERKKAEVPDGLQKEMPKGYELILDCTIRHKDGLTTDFYVVVQTYGRRVVCPSSQWDGIESWLLGFRQGLYEMLDDEHTHRVMMDFLDPAMRS